MRDKDVNTLESLFAVLFQAHPWHGISPGPHAPATVSAFIEIVPADGVKFELDKASGHLKLDRPQRYSSLCPTLYGFIPQTYCGAEVARRCAEKTGTATIEGDLDPLDICVLTERTIPHGNFLVRARPIGGLRLIDGTAADDKIIAVLEEDAAFGMLEDVAECPRPILDRLTHYFLTYKEMPAAEPRRIRIAEMYGGEEAQEVIRCSMHDYASTYGDKERRVAELARLLGA
jgi:inorganic pyrophosphatase